MKAKNKIKIIFILLFFLVGFYLCFFGNQDLQCGDSILNCSANFESGMWKMLLGIAFLLMGINTMESLSYDHDKNR